MSHYINLKRTLQEIRILSLENKRTSADKALMYKCLHNKLKRSAADVGLPLNANNNIPGGNFSLEQQYKQLKYQQYFF